MQFFCFFAVSLMSFFGSCEAAKINDLFVEGNLCGPWFFFKPFLMRDPLVPMLTGRAGVGSILPVCCFAQIFNAVVGPNAINMVDLLFGPDCIDVKPCQAVRRIRFPIEFYIDVPLVLFEIPGRLANLDFWSRRGPRKNPSVWIIIQSFRKFLMRDHGLYFARPRKRLQLERKA